MMQSDLLSLPEDPTFLFLPADTLPPDLRTTERFLAPQPAGLVPGAIITGPGGSLAPSPAASLSPFTWPGAPPVQGDNLLNGTYQSGVNTALAIVLQGAGSVRIHLYSLIMRTSAGVATFSLSDGPTVLIPVGMIALGVALTTINWPIALTIRENNACTINIGAAGAGNTVIVTVQADRF